MNKNMTLKYALLVCLIHAVLLCGIFFNLKMPKIAADGSNSSGLIQVKWLGSDSPRQAQQKSEQQPMPEQPRTHKQNKPEIAVQSPDPAKAQPKLAPTQQSVLLSTAKSDQQRSAGGAAVAQDRSQHAATSSNSRVASANANNRLTEPTPSATTAQQSASTIPKHAGSAAGGTTAAAKSQQHFKVLNRRVNYPIKAKSMGVEGRVKVAYDISQGGSVINIQIIDESPTGLFATAVKQDMRRWRFQTTQAVSNQMVTIVFKLDGKVLLQD